MNLYKLHYRIYSLSAVDATIISLLDALYQSQFNIAPEYWLTDVDVNSTYLGTSFSEAGNPLVKHFLSS